MLQCGQIVCAISRRSPRPLPYNGLIFLQLRSGRLQYTGSGHSKSRRDHKDFGPDQSTILSEQFQRQILTFLPVFFFKHKQHLILPKIIQKNLEIG